MRVVVGITGATGSIYGIRLLQLLGRCGVETELVISRWAEETIRCETDYTVEQVAGMASHVHRNDNLAAPIASGSYPADAMVIAPCSMKTLAGLAHGYDDDLMIRAADVMLKERRRLILLARETPLQLNHIENMRTVTLMGGIIMPPAPAFYHRPERVEEIVDHTVGRVLDLLKVEDMGVVKRWQGGDAR